MAAPIELNTFVHDALARGVPRERVDHALRHAGWTGDVIATALAGYADVDFPVPVPAPKPYVSAREAVTYALLFGTLYLSAYHLGSLLFAFVEHAFPDGTGARSVALALGRMRWDLATLVVAFPVFLTLAWRVARMLAVDPAKRRSNVRRWLIYLTLLVAASVFIGDLITLVYNALSGEMTSRLAAKVAVIAAIAGTALGYYLADLRIDDADRAERLTAVKRGLAAWTVTAAAATAIVAAAIVGAPSQARAGILDEQRIDTLNRINYEATRFFETHRRLALSLDELAVAGHSQLTTDETASGQYEYRPTAADGFEVCSTFEAASGRRPYLGTAWAHPAGRACFAFGPLRTRPGQP